MPDDDPTAALPDENEEADPVIKPLSDTAPGDQPPSADDLPAEEEEDLREDLANLTLPSSDLHSRPVGPLDVHSVPKETPGPEKVSPARAVTVPAPIAQSAPAVAPAVGATVQATKAAATTAKQATQQVTAAVANQAQKITVAPRKAIYRGKRFLIVYGSLVGAAGVLGVLARRYRYFPADVGITRILQKPNNKLYEALMTAVSQLGWRWISVGTRGSITTLMWAAGFRMESVFTLSTWSGDVLTMLIKHPVDRPRPTKDLVRVVSSLQEASFPSGHVVHYVTFYGFLFYLVFTHLKQRWFRTALLTFLAGVILLVGPSRIYMGHHWPSDVGGAYLVGTLWLGLLIIAYLETKAHYTLHTHPPFLVPRRQQLG